MWQRQWQIRIWSRCFAFSCVLFSSSSHHHGTLNNCTRHLKFSEWKGTPAGPHRPLPVKLRQKSCSRCVRSSQIHPTEKPTNTSNWNTHKDTQLKYPQIHPTEACLGATPTKYHLTLSGCAVHNGHWGRVMGLALGSDKGRSSHLLMWRFHKAA